MVLVNFVVHDFPDALIRPPDTLSRNAHFDITKSLDGVSQIFCVLRKNHEDESGITLCAFFSQNLPFVSTPSCTHAVANTYPTDIPMRNPRRRYRIRLRYI